MGLSECRGFLEVLYSLIEIENVNSLELIEMGEVNDFSYNFLYASLELKSE